jgi:hypothetical protein
MRRAGFTRTHHQPWFPRTAWNLLMKYIRVTNKTLTPCVRKTHEVSRNGKSVFPSHKQTQLSTQLDVNIHFKKHWPENSPSSLLTINVDQNLPSATLPVCRGDNQTVWVLSHARGGGLAALWKDPVTKMLNIDLAHSPAVLLLWIHSREMCSQTNLDMHVHRLFIIISIQVPIKG